MPNLVTQYMRDSLRYTMATKSGIAYMCNRALYVGNCGPYHNVT
jgi:hypothetical protein